MIKAYKFVLLPAFMLLSLLLTAACIRTGNSDNIRVFGRSSAADAASETAEVTAYEKPEGDFNMTLLDDTEHLTNEQSTLITGLFDKYLNGMTASYKECGLSPDEQILYKMNGYRSSFGNGHQFRVTNILHETDNTLLCAVLQETGSRVSTESVHAVLHFVLLERPEHSWKVGDVYGFDTVTGETAEEVYHFLFAIYENVQKDIDYSEELIKECEEAAVRAVLLSAPIIPPEIYSKEEIDELAEAFSPEAVTDVRKAFGDYLAGWSEKGTSFSDPVMIVRLGIDRSILSEELLDKAEQTFGADLSITLRMTKSGKEWKMAVMNTSDIRENP